MWALIKKDMYMLSSICKSILFVFVMFFVVSFANSDPSIFQFFSMMIVVFVMMLIISTFTYDNTSHWESYTLTLPISRKTCVASKYVMTLVMMVFGCLLGFVFYLLLTLLSKQPVDYTMLYMLNCFSVAGAFFILSIVLPVIYKIGPEKGRYIMMVCYLLPMVLFYLAGSLKEKMNIDVEAAVAWLQSNAWVLPVASLVVFFFSFLLSVKIYQNKEA